MVVTAEPAEEEGMAKGDDTAAGKRCVVDGRMNGVSDAEVEEEEEEEEEEEGRK